MIILKVTKNQSFILSLEDTFFEKTQGGRGCQLDPSAAVFGLNEWFDEKTIFFFQDSNGFLRLSVIHWIYFQLYIYGLKELQNYILYIIYEWSLFCSLRIYISLHFLLILSKKTFFFVFCVFHLISFELEVIFINFL